MIIVSWNVKDKLRSCLNSVLKNNATEIYVVDNNSSDGSVDMVRESFPGVNLIENSVNKGFAFACNQAIKKSQADIILLLNPDAELRDGALNMAEIFFHEHTEAGIVGGKILDKDNSIQKSVRKLPSIFSQVMVVTKIARIFKTAISDYLMDDFDYSRDNRVEQVSGALFFVTKKFIQKAGYLDEGYFIWFEEVDWCKKAKELGFEVWYTPTISAHHIGGASFYQLSHLQRQRLFNASLLYYFKKNHSFGSYLILKLFTPIGILESLIIDIFKPHV